MRHISMQFEIKCLEKRVYYQSVWELLKHVIFGIFGTKIIHRKIRNRLFVCHQTFIYLLYFLLGSKPLQGAMHKIIQWNKFSVFFIIFNNEVI